MTLQSEARERRVGSAFVELADTLVDDYDVIDILDRLVAHSVDLLAADAAGIMLLDPRRQLRTVAYSSDESGWVEFMQLQTNDGPFVDCGRAAEPVTVTDLDTAAARWPGFTAALRERTTPDGHRFRSVHALPLRLRGQAIGGMNLFHTRPGPLPPADLRLGQALADVATIGILQERAIRDGAVVTQQLQGALNSRIVIEQAKGVLAQAGNLTMDAAFEHLRSYSRSHNRKLSELAEQVVTNRALVRQVLGVSIRGQS